MAREPQMLCTRRTRRRGEGVNKCEAEETSSGRGGGGTGGNASAAKALWTPSPARGHTPRMVENVSFRKHILEHISKLLISYECSEGGPSSARRVDDKAILNAEAAVHDITSKA